MTEPQVVDPGVVLQILANTAESEPLLKAQIDAAVWRAMYLQTQNSDESEGSKLSAIEETTE